MELGYLGFEVRDMVAWRRLATEIIGLLPIGLNEDGSEGFRVDRLSQRLFIRPGPKDDICAFGLVARNAAEFEDRLRRLTAAGVAVEVGTADEAAARHVKKVVRFVDPAGVPVELAHGPAWTHEPFHSPIAISGFVTEELGLGHCLFLTEDLATTTSFYVDVLGMEVSETAMAPWRGHMLEASFFTCNPRHHSIAFAEVPGPIAKLTTHFELQLPTIDDVGRAYDRAIGAGVRLSNTLGRHTDGVFSFYAQTPSGFDFELGTGGYLIDEKWRSAHMKSYILWGHQFVGAA